MQIPNPFSYVLKYMYYTNYPRLKLKPSYSICSGLDLYVQWAIRLHHRARINGLFTAFNILVNSIGVRPSFTSILQRVI